MDVRVNRSLLFIFCLLKSMLELGIVISFGAVYVALLDKYKRDRSTTVTVQSLLLGVPLSLSIVGGSLISKLGLPLVTLISCILVPVGFSVSFFATRIEHLYISIGVVSGFGISFGFVSTTVIIGRIFKGKKGALCLAAQSTLSSLSGLVYPYFLDWLIGIYGLNGTFLILGAIYSNTFPLFIICLFHRTSLNEASLSSSKISKVEKDTDSEEPNQTIRHKRNIISTSMHTLRQMINNRYLLLIPATAVSFASLDGYLAMILDVCRWKGFSESQGLFTLVIFNIANAVSRLLPGVLKQKKGISPFIFPIIATASGCVGQLLFYIGSNYAEYMIGTCLSGVAHGGVISSVPILVIKTVRPELFPVGLGLVLTMTGVISCVSGPIFGSLRDYSGTYGSVVLTICVTQAIAAILFVTALLYRHTASAKTRTEQPSHNFIFSIAGTQD